MTDLRQAAQQAIDALLLPTMKTQQMLIQRDEAIIALRRALEQPEQEPVSCEGAIVNGRVYADRLEHDYKFECEAGPLHLCTEWVEFRRCFEWLAEHATPPASQRPWVELTASTILNMMPESIPAEHDGALMEFARDIEAKLKERNT